MQDLFVNYSLVGHARRFQTRVKAAVRRDLRAGDIVIVHGDDVGPGRARVLPVASDIPDVQLELLDD